MNCSPKRGRTSCPSPRMQVAPHASGIACKWHRPSPFIRGALSLASNPRASRTIAHESSSVSEIATVWSIVRLKGLNLTLMSADERRSAFLRHRPGCGGQVNTTADFYLRSSAFISVHLPSIRLFERLMSATRSRRAGHGPASAVQMRLPCPRVEDIDAPRTDPYKPALQTGRPGRRPAGMRARERATKVAVQMVSESSREAHLSTV